MGFEPSTDHARVATRLLNLPVVRDYFSATRVAGNAYDLIMLSHVIEHIYDPRAFVHEIIKVLKPGGVLIVLTPNNESLVARVTGKAWPMLKPVDHVSMIGSLAYDFFGLREIAEVHHSSSEYPFEFAAAAIAALRSSMPRSRRNSGAHAASTPRAEPPPLRRFGIKSNALRWCLTAVSAPMYAAGFAAGRQACLKSIVVRKA